MASEIMVPTSMFPPADTEATLASSSSFMCRRELNLKAKIESCVSNYSFKRLVLDAFNVDLIG